MLKKLPAHEWRLTLSTIITLMRIGLVPFIVISMIFHAWGSAFVLFVIAAFTDFLDGNIARWRNEQTFLGACLDPIADKLLLLSVFFTLACIQTPLFAIPRWFFLLVLMKELVVIGGACAIYAVRGGLRVQPTLLGKMTTVVQIAFIIWLFACYFFAWLPVKTYWVALGLVSVIVGVSGVQYVRIGIAQARKGSSC